MNHLGDLISTVLQTAARELPREGMIAVWFALIVGLLIWFRGRKMAKLAFAGFGAVVLGMVGFVIADSIGDGSSAWMGGAVGIIAGAILGSVLLRFTVAVALALVFAVVVPMVSTTAMQKWGTPPELRAGAQSAADSTRALLLDGVPEVAKLPAAKDLAVDALRSSEDGKEVADGLDRARAFLARLGEELRPVWDQIPEDDRMLLGASSVVGAGMGFLIGMVFHKKATALVTAGVGAALWVPAAVVAYSSFPQVPQVEIPSWPGLWAGVWAGAVVVGVILQSRGRKQASDTRRQQKAPSAG